MLKPARAAGYGYLSSISSKASFTYGELSTSLLEVLTASSLPTVKSSTDVMAFWTVADVVRFLRLTQEYVAAHCQRVTVREQNSVRGPCLEAKILTAT